MVETLWSESTRPIDGDEVRNMDRAFLWGAMTAIADTNPGLVNRRAPSRNEVAVAKMLGGENPAVKIQRRPVFSRTNPSWLPDVERREKGNKGSSIRSRAELIAEKIRSDGSRVLGAMEGGGKNPSWTTAIARAIKKKGMCCRTLKGWTNTLPDKKIDSAHRHRCEDIMGWNTEPISEKKPDGEEGEERHPHKPIILTKGGRRTFVAHHVGFYAPQ